MGRASSPEWTVRPHPAALIGVPSAYGAIVTAGILAGPPASPGQLLSVAVMIAATLGSMAVAVKERVVVDGSSVRVVRLFTSDEVARSTIERVAQSSGRGRPASLITTGGGVRLPALMTARRLAGAIDVPVTTTRGGPVAAHPFRDFVGAARDAEGRIRPIAWAYAIGLAVLFALLAAMLAAPT